MKKVIVCFLFLLAITGCAGGKEEKAICTNESMGMKIETKIEAKDDKVFKITQTSNMDIEKAGYDEEQAEDLGKQIASQYKSFKGLTYSYEVKKYVFSETLVYDLEMADLKELQVAGFISYNDEKISYVGLKETKKQYEDNDYTCK